MAEMAQVARTSTVQLMTQKGYKNNAEYAHIYSSVKKTSSKTRLLANTISLDDEKQETSIHNHIEHYNHNPLIFNNNNFPIAKQNYKPNNNNDINVSVVDNNTNIINYATKDEINGLIKLHNWIKQDRLSQKLGDELRLGDLILSYFSSLTSTNPDPEECWKRWIHYRHKNKDINYQKIKLLLQTGVFSIGFTNDKRPVWIINTQYYDSSFGSKIISQAAVLFISSFFWNLSTNEFDFNALRNGLDVYINASHWTMTSVSLKTIKKLTAALTSLPFIMVKTYIVNPPKFLKKAKKFASKVFPAHAMEKMVELQNMEEYFEMSGVREKTPICCGGTSKINAVQWMQQRGYFECAKQNRNGKLSKQTKAKLKGCMKLENELEAWIFHNNTPKE